jgi:hypothetical protein
LENQCGPLLITGESVRYDTDTFVAGYPAFPAGKQQSFRPLAATGGWVQSQLGCNKLRFAAMIPAATSEKLQLKGNGIHHKLYYIPHKITYSGSYIAEIKSMAQDIDKH